MPALELDGAPPPPPAPPNTSPPHAARWRAPPAHSPQRQPAVVARARGQRFSQMVAARHAEKEVERQRLSGKLHRVAAAGDLEMVGVLLERGADPNAPDAEGFTVLSRATDPHVIGALVEAGARYTVAARGGTRLVQLLSGASTGVGREIFAVEDDEPPPPPPEAPPLTEGEAALAARREAHGAAHRRLAGGVSVVEDALSGRDGALEMAEARLSGGWAAAKQDVLGAHRRDKREEGTAERSGRRRECCRRWLRRGSIALLYPLWLAGGLVALHWWGCLLLLLVRSCRRSLGCGGRRVVDHRGRVAPAPRKQRSNPWAHPNPRYRTMGGADAEATVKEAPAVTEALGEGGSQAEGGNKADERHGARGGDAQGKAPSDAQAKAKARGRSGLDGGRTPSRREGGRWQAQGHLHLDGCGAVWLHLLAYGLAWGLVAGLRLPLLPGVAHCFDAVRPALPLLSCPPSPPRPTALAAAASGSGVGGGAHEAGTMGWPWHTGPGSVLWSTRGVCWGWERLRLAHLPSADCLSSVPSSETFGSSAAGPLFGASCFGVFLLPLLFANDLRLLWPTAAALYDGRAEELRTRWQLLGVGLVAFTLGSVTLGCWSMFGLSWP